MIKKNSFFKSSCFYILMTFISCALGREKLDVSCMNNEILSEEIFVREISHGPISLDWMDSFSSSCHSLLHQINKNFSFQEKEEQLKKEIADLSKDFRVRQYEISQIIEDALLVPYKNFLFTEHGVQQVSIESLAHIQDIALAEKVIGARQDLISILLNDEELRVEVLNLMKEYQSIEVDIAKLKNECISYLFSFIPDKDFLSFKSSPDKRAHMIKYLVKSAYKVYGSSIIGSLVIPLINLYNVPQDGHGGRAFIDIIMSIFPCLKFLPIGTNAFNNVCKELFENKTKVSIEDLSNMSKLDSGLSLKDAIGKLEASSKEVVSLSQRSDILNNYPHASVGDGIKKSKIQIQFKKDLTGEDVGFLNKNLFYYGYNISGPLIHSIMGIFSLLSTVDAVRTQIQNVRQFPKFLNLIVKKVLVSFKLFNKVERAFTEKNIGSCTYEHLFARSELSKNAVRDLKKACSSWNSSGVGGFCKRFIGTILPGYVSKFYFDNIDSNKTLGILDRFVGLIDAAQAKAQLVLTEKYCLPSISFSNDVSPYLDFVDMFFPKLYEKADGKVVSNSIALRKNSVLISPNAGGKTKTLDAIAANVYMANSGICAARQAKFSYFSKIIPFYRDVSVSKLNSSMALSAGEKELRKFEEVKQEIHDLCFNKGKRVLFLGDEMFTATMPEQTVLHLQRAFNFMKSIPNVMSFLVTHYQGIMDVLSQDMSNETCLDGLYYMKVEYNKIMDDFYNTYKIHSDFYGSTDNWWFKDSEMRKKYHEKQVIKHQETINQAYTPLYTEVASYKKHDLTARTISKIFVNL